MAEIVKMPKMSDTMEEGVIAVWHKKVGDKVESGELMAEIETDKATMDYESFNEGTVLYLGAEEGEAVQVNGILAIVGEEGEDYKALLNGESGSSSEEKKEESKAQAAPASTEKIDTSNIKAEIVRMPKMSDTMEEGVIAAWHKKVGDTVEAGELMAEVETDKATMEYESYHDGTVLYLGAKEGESVKVEGILAIVGEKGADYEALIKAEQQGSNGSEEKEEAKETVAAPTPESSASSNSQAPASTSDNSSSNGRLKASPLAKRLAEEKGINIQQVQGSGEGGRIVKRDVENFVPAQQPAAQPAAAKTASAPVVLPKVVGEESYEEFKVSQMRKTIAKRLAQSKFTAPHFYLTMEINMDKAIVARQSMNEISPVKISFNDMVIKAAAVALRKHPQVNSSWLEDKIRINNHVHIGVAVAVEDGLLVPVVRFADNKPLSHISAEVKELGGKAKNKELQPKDWEGNTFTISNLGMFGIDEFTAIINPPDACIMAVGGIKETAVVKDGQLTIGNIMKVTLSCDHRVVDGAVGSAFLQTFKSLLEDPVRILV